MRGSAELRVGDATHAFEGPPEGFGLLRLDRVEGPAEIEALGGPGGATVTDLFVYARP